MRSDGAAHFFGQQFGDGQPEAGSVPGRFHGVKAVKQALGLHAAEGWRAVREGDGTIWQQTDRKIAVRVFDGIAQDIVEDTAQRGGVQLAGDLLLRQVDRRCDAAGGQYAVKGSKALL